MAHPVVVHEHRPPILTLCLDGVRGLLPPRRAEVLLEVRVGRRRHRRRKRRRRRRQWRIHRWRYILHLRGALIHTESAALRHVLCEGLSLADGQLLPIRAEGIVGRSGVAGSLTFAKALVATVTTAIGHVGSIFHATVKKLFVRPRPVHCHRSREQQRSKKRAKMPARACRRKRRCGSDGGEHARGSGHGSERRSEQAQALRGPRERPRARSVRSSAFRFFRGV
jgi:hypothetical protein